MSLTPLVDTHKHTLRLLCLLALSVHYWVFMHASFQKNPEKPGTFCFYCTYKVPYFLHSTLWHILNKEYFLFLFVNVTVIDGRWECRGFLNTWHINTWILEWVFISRHAIVSLKFRAVDIATGGIIKYFRSFGCRSNKFNVLHIYL